MKNYTIAFLISAFIFTACSAPVPTNTNVGNAANTAQNQSAPNSNSTTGSATSPIETMKILNEAAKKKDAATMKSLVSKGTLEILEKNAKEQNTTVEELLKKDEGETFEELPEMRNENIAGERATVEVKNKLSDKWATVPFVKEDGVWKIALDEYFKDIERQMLEDLKKPAVNSDKEKGADKKETNANKAAKN